MPDQAAKSCIGIKNSTIFGSKYDSYRSTLEDNAITLQKITIVQ